MSGSTSLLDAFREEIKRMISSPQWTERGLAESIGCSQGKIQGWTREKTPTRPSMDELSPLASVKGVLTAELVAELLGENYVPTEGKTLEEVGEEISAADSRGLRELAKGFLRAGGEAKGREFLQALLDEMLSGKTA